MTNNLNEVPLSALFSVLAILIVLSGFFSGSETALMTLNRYRLRHLANGGHRGARRAAKLLEKPDRLLGLILLGNNAINLSASALATVIALRLYGEAAIAVATFILTLLVLIFAEVAPKTLAAKHPEPLAFFASYIYTPLLHPYCPLVWIVWIVNVFANGLLDALGLNKQKATSDNLSTDELRTVLNETGGLIPDEHQTMLLNILDLEKITVNDIMVPRNEIHGIDLDDSWKEISQQITGSPHGRVPVFHESIDNVQGFIYLRKFIDLRRRKEVTLEHLKSQIHEAYFIPENTPLTVQLLNFQKDAKRIGLVVDEYGDILGLVTVEDILEEIVGEFTSSPADEHEMVIEDDGSILADGGIALRHLNRHLGWSTPADGPKTLNGLILEYLENIPEPGTTFLIDNHPVEIIEIRDNVVQSARIFPAIEEKSGDSETAVAVAE
ncbi:MAG: HlyC/CorC family transporter [Pseudomonadota bacterium]